MAVTCTAPALATGAQCFSCVPIQTLQAIQILLLCDIINGVTVNCDANTLVASAVASKYNSLSPQQQAAVITTLLCSVASGGGVGGGGVSCEALGGATPTTPPSGDCAILIDTDTGTYWSFYSGAWH